MRKFTLIILFFALFANVLQAQTPVAAHGQLSISGTKVVDKNGENVCFSGMSFFWSNDGWGGEKYYNADVVDWLKSDWNVPIVRVAMGVQESGGYIGSPSNNKARVKTVVQAAIDKGLYVIIDWHSHTAENNKADAITFFKEMANTYGSYPNIIYEIYNEPLAVSWSNVIKPYALDVIAAIRAIDKKNIIVVGTPNWSQDVDVASKDKITGYDNIAYTLHFYAATHKQWYRDKAQTAINNGCALIITEWGTVNNLGAGAVDATSTNEWMTFIKTNSITACNWAVNDKPEGASVLNVGVSSTGNWSASNLTASGVVVKDLIKNWEGNKYSATPTAPVFASATTNINATAITATFSSALNTPVSTSYSNFTLKINGAAVSSAFTAISLSSAKVISLQLAASVKIKSGDVITLSYAPGTIAGTNSIALDAFYNATISNTVSGGNTIVADAENGSATKFLTNWYSYKDANAATTVTPLATETAPFVMTAGGANGTANAAKITYNVTEYVGLGFDLTTGSKPYDLTGSTGISFYHKGDACAFQVSLSTITNFDNYSANVDSHTDWTLVTFTWDQLKQQGWNNVYTAWDATKINKLQWQVKTNGSTKAIWIDEVQVNNKTISFPITQLQVAITNAKSTLALANGNTGTAVGNYPQTAVTALQTAIATAEKSLTATTETAITAAITALNKEVTTFTNSVVPDKSALNTLIAEVKAFQGANAVGVKIGQYPQTQWTALTTELAIAERELSNSSSTKSTVTAEITKLQTALNALKNAVNTTELASNIPDLEAAIANAQTALAKSTNNIGTKPNNYPQASVTALQTAITTAQKSLTSTSTDAVTTAITTLNTAVSKYNAAQITELTATTVEVTRVAQSSDFIVIEASSTIKSISIVSIAGNILKTDEIESSTAKISLQNIASGMYIVLLQLDESMETVKLIHNNQ